MPPFRVAETGVRVCSSVFAWFFTRYTELSRSPSPADFTVCGPDSSHGPRMAGMHGHRSPLWHLCVHPFLYVGSAPRQMYGLLSGVAGWISAPAPLPLNWGLSLLHVVARDRRVVFIQSHGLQCLCRCVFVLCYLLPRWVLLQVLNVLEISSRARSTGGESSTLTLQVRSALTLCPTAIESFQTPVIKASSSTELKPFDTQIFCPKLYLAPEFITVIHQV